MGEGVILKGHGRLLAATQAELATFPVVQRIGLSEATKKGMRIHDNQIALLSGWDMSLMRVETAELQTLGYDMRLLGFDQAQLQEFAAPTLEQADGNKGSLLELVNITIAEPKHVVEHGEHYILSGRHHLVIENVVSGWPRWVPLLTENALFCPYPGVFVPFGHKAEAHPLIMVQSDLYIAGHILDRYAEVHGKRAIKKVTS